MKLRRALAVLVLLAAIVIPVTAAPAVVTGGLYSGFTTDGTNVGYYGYPYLYANATVSPWISTTFMLYYYMGYVAQDGYTTTDTPITSWLQFPTIYYAHVNIDMTQPFGIDAKMFNFVLNAGYNSTGDNGYDILTASYPGYISSAGAGLDWVLTGTAKLVDLLYFKGGVAPRSIPSAPNYWFGAYATPAVGPGTLKAEAFYDSNSKAAGTLGFMTVTGQYVLPMGTDTITAPAFGFRYYLNDNSWQYTVSAKYVQGSYPFVNVAAEVWGTSVYALYGADATIYVTPVVFNDGKSKDKDGKEVVDANAAVSLDICSNLKFFFYNGATTNIPQIEVAGRLNIGTADVYVGYCATTVGTYTWGGNIVMAQGATFTSGTTPTVAALQNGGAYIRVYLPW
jgi:hypothetical protein